MAESTAPGTARVDAWLWGVRIYRTRSAATAACKAGHVRVNGDRAKPSQSVRPGDEVTVRTDRDRVLEVVRPITKRVSATLAAEALIDRSPALPPREERPGPVLRDRGAGRPTKRDRRDIERLRGR